MPEGPVNLVRNAVPVWTPAPQPVSRRASQAPAPFPTTPILDDCNRANTGPPSGPGWTTGLFGTPANEHGWIIQTNEMRPQGTYTAPQFASQYWSTALGSNDHEVYVTDAWDPAFANHELWARVANPGTSSVSAYVVTFYHNGGVIQKYVSGAWTDLTQGFVTAFVNSPTGMGLRVAGNTITVFIRPPSGQWYPISSVVDSSLTTGSYIGIIGYDNNLSYDDFGGGAYVDPNVGTVTNATQTVSAAGVGAPVFARQPGHAVSVGSAGVPVFVRAPGHRVTTTGAGAASLVRGPGRVVSAVGSGASILTRSPSKSLQAAATGSVSLASSLVKSFTVAAAAVGAVTFVRRPGKVATIASTGAPAFTRRPAHTVTGAGTGAPAFARAPAHTIAATGSGSVALAASKVVLQAIAAVASGAVSFVRSPLKRVTLSSTGAVTFTRRPGKNVTTSGSGAVALSASKVVLQAIAATASSIVTMIRRPTHAVSVTSTGTSSLTRRASHSVAAAGAGAVSLARRPAHTIATAASSAVSLIAEPIAALTSFVLGMFSTSPRASVFNSSVEEESRVTGDPSAAEFDPPNPGVEA